MSSRPRTPGVVYTGVSLALLVVLTAIAFSTRQPPPPTIAEFAPNAIEQIEDAPEEQSAPLGEGTGACPAGQPFCLSSPSPTPTPTQDRPVINVNRVRKCIGNPPRQIEDPQSPPCVPYWEGDNGGATYKGVTADEIRIAMPSACPSIERCKLDEIENSARFFNKRFEFYGRKITIVDTSETAVCEDDDVAGSKATARQAAEEYRVFGSIECGSGDPEYAKELARLGRLFIGYENFFGVNTARRYHPHLWMYPMEPEAVFAHMGEWACKRVVGGIARHTPDRNLKDKPRKFGVILTPFVNADIRPEELTNRLRACGANLGPIVVDPDPNTTNVLLRMRNEGVTSIFCLCHILNEAAIGNAATAQAYFPEWLISGYDINYYNRSMKLSFPPEQRRQVFGIQLLPMQQRPEDWPSVWMCREVDPQCDTTLPAIGPYHAMLLLASGIQMAGPNLTPETFAEGLRKTMFPNPDHQIIPGKVGFDQAIIAGDPKYSAAANMPHGMTIDGIEFWWSESAPGPNADEGNGAMCYVARKRYRLSEYAKGPDTVFFKGRCDSGGT